jgi:hypothetical protein
MGPTTWTLPDTHTREPILKSLQDFPGLTVRQDAGLKSGTAISPRHGCETIHEKPDVFQVSIFKLFRKISSIHEAYPAISIPNLE